MFRKFLAPFVFLASLFGAHQQTQTIDTVARSLVRITGQTDLDTFFGRQRVNYVCSGFVISANRVLTANHCVGDMMQADGVAVEVLRKDEFYDLALLAVSTNKPAVVMRYTEVARGELVTGVGYGYGLAHYIFTDNKVLLVDFVIAPAYPPGLVVLHPYVPGMSGGPVVDSDGKIVGMVQDTTEVLGWGVGTLLIKAFLLGT